LSQFLNDCNFQEGLKIYVEMSSMLLVGVTSVEYVESFCPGNYTVQKKSSIR
jgi:hypothetical protein